ncbi:aldo/keto reductase [Devosia sp. ZB163]|uniref:aldo/keto reductase n=1 Tax=Devosia sp. ZB163 TaxID=3025938 RepID=UPI00235E0156|nr:aldo/keto reductase [Devosia sp. ZB163]MDC9825279.1 aldo/keto reductase [Devosia sp. ZB163]
MTIKLSDRGQVAATSLSLPPLGFGAAHLGGMYNRVSGDTANATLAAAWDGGVRYYDTAPFYGRGLSELRTGTFLIDKPRDEFVITTKVGRYFKRPADPRTFDRTPWGGGLNMEIVWDYSYDGIMRSYEQSLLRLGLDTIDALLIHDPEAAASPGGPKLEDLEASGIRALEELKRTGHIKAIGMGLNHADSLDTIAPRVQLDFCIVAMPYTLLNQSALRTGLKRCVDENISVIVGAPYASGILATGPIPGARYAYGIAEPDILDKTRRIQAVCAGHGVSLQAAALQFPLAHPAVVSVIPGGARPEEVTANVGFVQEAIPAAFWSDLTSAGLIDPEAPTPA